VRDRHAGERAGLARISLAGAPVIGEARLGKAARLIQRDEGVQPRPLSAFARAMKSLVSSTDEIFLPASAAESSETVAFSTYSITFGTR
jgi:hypothetical protein